MVLKKNNGYIFPPEILEKHYLTELVRVKK